VSHSVAHSAIERGQHKRGHDDRVPHPTVPFAEGGLHESPVCPFHTSAQAGAPGFAPFEPWAKGERPNTKRIGELAEAAFLHKAEILGLKLCKPWGDSNRYDFILDNGEPCLRIQVKATQSINARGYQVQSTYCNKKKKGKYTARDVDFLSRMSSLSTYGMSSRSKPSPPACPCACTPKAESAVPASSNTAKPGTTSDQSDSRKRFNCDRTCAPGLALFETWGFSSTHHLSLGNPSPKNSSPLP